MSGEKYRLVTRSDFDGLVCADFRISVCPSIS